MEPERFKKFQEISSRGGSYLSYYDFIRVYDPLNVWDYDLNVPASYLDQYYIDLDNVDMIKNSTKLLKCASYYDLICYPVLFQNLQDKYANQLSIVSDIPISYIKRRLDLKWNWQYISQFNITFHEKDLDELKEYLYTTGLSQNPAILFEWIFKRSSYYHWRCWGYIL